MSDFPGDTPAANAPDGIEFWAARLRFVRSHEEDAHRVRDQILLEKVFAPRANRPCASSFDIRSRCGGWDPLHLAGKPRGRPRRTLPCMGGAHAISTEESAIPCFDRKLHDLTCGCDGAVAVNLPSARTSKYENIAMAMTTIAAAAS